MNLLVFSVNAKTIEVNIQHENCNDKQGQPYCHIMPAIKASPENSQINIASGVYYETVLIDKNLTLLGFDKNTTVINANGHANVVKIDPGVHVGLESLTLQNGLADYGAGIYNLGTLSINKVRIINNTARLSGGGIYNSDSISGSLVIKNSLISHNYAKGEDALHIKYGGGGLFNDGPLSVENSEFKHNWASENGGGIYSIYAGRKKYSEGEILGEMLGLHADHKRQRHLQRKKDFGSVQVNNTLFQDNTADAGGGINLHGVMKLEQSIVRNNSADRSALSEGGGIFTHFDNSLSMSNTLIYFNKASSRGGGIRYYSSNMGYFSNVSIVDNIVLNPFGKAAGLLVIMGDKVLSIKDSLIARNKIQRMNSQIPIIDDCSGNFQSGGNNYFSSISNCNGFDKNLDKHVAHIDAITPYLWNENLSLYQIKNNSRLLDYVSKKACKDEKNNIIRKDVYGKTRKISRQCGIGAIGYL